MKRLTPAFDNRLALEVWLLDYLSSALRPIEVAIMFWMYV